MEGQGASGDSEPAENRKNSKLPELSKGQVFENVQADISEHFTSAPKRFTEDQLLLSMDSSPRFLSGGSGKAHFPGYSCTLPVSFLQVL